MQLPSMPPPRLVLLPASFGTTQGPWVGEGKERRAALGRLSGLIAGIFPEACKGRAGDKSKEFRLSCR